MFDNRKTPRQILNYNLYRGVTDWTNLKQFDYYEKGYPFLIVLRYPKWVELNLPYETEATRNMINTYLHILENEFVGLEGIENITTGTGEISNGIRTLNYINKVEQASGTFTMEFKERAGMPITRTHEYILTGIKDKETQVKTYHGLIDHLREELEGGGFKYTFEPGLDKEVFSFLYFVSDNTMSQIEAAYLIVGAQPTSAELSIADQKRGEIDNSTISVQFNGIALNNDFIDGKAKACLDIMRNTKNRTNSRVLVNSTKFAYREATRIEADFNANSITSKGENTNASTVNTYVDAIIATNNGREHSINPTSAQLTDLKNRAANED